MTTSARAQDAPQKRVTLPAESKETALRLAAADRLVRPEPFFEDVVALAGDAAGPGLFGLGHVLAHSVRQQWPKALEEYQRIIYDEGDNLVAVEAVPTTAAVRSVKARLLCHQRIAAAPPWARALYNKRVKNLVDNLFRDGQENRNLQAWRRLVSDHFCSQPAEKTLELLGDIAFENGDFAQARQWWGLLAELPSGMNNMSERLTYPAGDSTRARAQARQILALAHERDFERARAEWKLFQKIHGNMPGKLAGKQGPLAATIKGALERFQEARTHEERPWHSFGCDGTRNQRVPVPPHARLWADGPAWRVFLASGKKAESPDGISARAVPQPARRLAFHPVVVDDKVLVADARSVTGYHLLSGHKLFRYHLKEARRDDELDDAERSPVEPERGYTVSVAGKRLYVRLGGQRIGPGTDGKKETSYLACLEMTPGKKAPVVEIQEVWQVAAQAEDGNVAQFEGSPIIEGNRVFMALSRVQGRRTLTALVCYDAGTGAVRWSQEVCEADEFELSSQPRFRHHLVTLAGQYLVYCAHAGAVVAVDAETGKSAWAVRYPSQGMERADGSRSPRDLCPVVFAAGRLYVAPADSDRVLCLEPVSGEVLWERDGIEVVHLLGVSGERLFFTTPSGFRAVRADRGTDQGGWSQPADGNLPPFGRGFLAGDWIFWPTQDPNFPLRVLTQDEGGQEQVERAGDPAPVFDPTQLRRLRAGNMVYANGCLIVAGTEELLAYVPSQRFLDKLRLQARHPGATAQTLFQLAQAEAGAGLHEDALRHFQAASIAPGRDHAGRRRALLARHELLMELARKHAVAGQDWKQAVSYLEQAGASDFIASRRLVARFELAELWRRTGEPERAVGVLQGVLLDDNLCDGSVTDPSGLWRPAAPLIRDQIERLIDQHGPRVYTTFEEQAGNLLKTAAQDRVKLEQIARCYPNSQKVKQLIAGALPRPEFKPPEPNDKLPSPSAPLALAWEQPADSLLRPQLPLSAPGQAQAVFLVQGNQVVFCDPATGKARWQRPVSFLPRWAGQHADRVVLAGDRDIEARRLADGRLVWRLQAGESGWGEFGSFQLTTAQLLLLQNARRLIALNLDSGKVRWSRLAPGALALPLDSGRFSSHYLATDHHVLVQAIRGQVQCLAGATGQLLRETPAGSLPWPHAPLAIGLGRACIVDGGHVVLVEIASGKEIWRFEPRWQTSSSGEPLRVAGNAKTLLAIVPRNYGYEVERLDAATGRPLWDDEPRLLTRRRADLASLAVADDALYYVGEGSLTCRSMQTGKVLWKKVLPIRNIGWQTRLTSTGLVVGPARDQPDPWLWMPLGSFLLALPTAQPPATPAIFLCDSKDGSLQQRLDLASAASGTVIEVFPETIAAFAGGSARAWRAR